MKDRSCLSEDELLLARDLPFDHPRRQHLHGCALCRSRLLCLDGFLHDTTIPAGARPDLAESRLAAAISQATGTGRASRKRRTYRVGGVVLALAAALAVFMIMPLTEEAPPGFSPSQVLRGNGPVRSWDLTSRWDPSGRVMLSWAAVDRADSYLLTFHDAALGEIGRVDAGYRTSWFMDSPWENTVFWRVTARKGNEILDISGPATLQPRPAGWK